MSPVPTPVGLSLKFIGLLTNIADFASKFGMWDECPVFPKMGKTHTDDIKTRPGCRNLTTRFSFSVQGLGLELMRRFLQGELVNIKYAGLCMIMGVNGGSYQGGAPLNKSCIQLRH